MHKSRVWYTPNTPLHLIQSITSQIGIPSTTNLGLYLGFPLSHGQLGSQQFQYLEEKVRSKLGLWQGKLLSWAARLILIQAVCAAILTYGMQVCKLLGRTLVALDKIHRNFLWGDLADRRSTHVVGWEQICQPRNMGGLGIRVLQKHNITMLAKLAWRFSINKDALWSQVLLTKYGVFEGWEIPLNRGGGSLIWRGLKARYDTLAAGIEWDHCHNQTLPRWTLNASGIFLTKSMYAHLCARADGGNPFP